MCAKRQEQAVVQICMVEKASIIADETTHVAYPLGSTFCCM
jgi:hypothetical protein